MSRRTLLAPAALACGLAAPALAEPDFLTVWMQRYPDSTLPWRMQARTGSSCYLCHIPPGYSRDGNCYRLDIRTRIGAGQTIFEALESVETLDSDGDGVSNLAEILAPHADLPGEIGYNPGLIGPTGTSPCSPEPSTPVSGQRETPPPAPACYANCDGSTIAPVLNVNDFICFQTKFAAADTYANCDGSTIVPILNVNDFICFQTRYAQGCP